MKKAILEEIKINMEKTVLNFKEQLNQIKTGEATPSILSNVCAKIQGEVMKLQHIANISVSDKQTLCIEPWNAIWVSSIVRALLEADFNASSQGAVVRVSIPTLSEITRKKTIKLVEEKTEVYKISIRNIRKKGNSALEELLDQKLLTKDEYAQVIESVQQLTNTFIKKIDQLVEKKKSDLLC